MEREATTVRSAISKGNNPKGMQDKRQITFSELIIVVIWARNPINS